MSTKKKEKQTALQFMKSYEDTLKIMEGIGNQTNTEQQSLMESSSKNDYTNEKGVFEMGNLMDVTIPQNSDDMQPQYYNSPMDDLTDGDKALIVDEFTNMVKKSHEEVIDFSEIGPVATVIQNKFGFKQNLDDFLTELVTSAVDKQDSQSFAQGEPVPGMKGRSDEMAEDGGPADIEPDQASPAGAAPGEDMGVDVSVDVEMGPDAGLDAGLDAELGDVDGEMAPVDGEMALEGDVVDEPVDALADPMPDVGDEPTDELVDPAEDMGGEDMGGEDMGVEDMAGEDMTGEDMAVEDMDAPAPESDDLADEEGMEELGEKKDDEEDDEEDDENKPPMMEGDGVSVEAQLESIKGEYQGKLEDKKIDAQLESIKDDLLNNKPIVESETSKEEAVVEVEQTPEEKLDAQLESIAAEVKKDKEEAVVEATDEPKKEEAVVEATDKPKKEEAVVEATDEPKKKEVNENKVKAQLEAIATGYHTEEDNKVKVAETEKKLDTTLESITANYHNGEKAKLEAIEAEKKLDKDLTTLVESYHTSTKTAKVENADQRKKVKEKIQELSK